MAEIIIKCIALVLCGAGIGSMITWRIMYQPRPMTQAEARRRAQELYEKLLEEVTAA